MERALERTRSEYPDLSFIIKKTLHKKKINEKLKLFDPNLGGCLYNNRSHIKPDGGLLYLVGSSGLEYLLVAGDAKIQGTNDIRKNEGKENQSKGNACERLFKNIRELENFLISEDIFPYFIFLSGCDFESGSSMLDRISSAVGGSEFNKNYLRNISQNKFRRTSIYVRYEPWTEDEMYESILNIIIEAVEHYLGKYPEEFAIE